jgi:hypothetical protein
MNFFIKSNPKTIKNYLWGFPIILIILISIILLITGLNYLAIGLILIILYLLIINMIWKINVGYHFYKIKPKSILIKRIYYFK